MYVHGSPRPSRLGILRQAPHFSPIMMLGSTKFRDIRIAEHKDESQPHDPLLDTSTSYLHIEDVLQENDLYCHDDEECGSGTPVSSFTSPHHFDESQDALLQSPRTRRSRWTRRRRIPPLHGWLTWGRQRKTTVFEKSGCDTYQKRRRPLRFVLKSLAIALMLL